MTESTENPIYNTQDAVWIQGTDFSYRHGLFVNFELRHESKKKTCTIGKSPDYLTSAYNAEWDICYNCHSDYIRRDDLKAIQKYLNRYQQLFIRLKMWPNASLLSSWWLWQHLYRRLFCELPIGAVASRISAHKEYLDELGQWPQFRRDAFARVLQGLEKSHE